MEPFPIKLVRADDGVEVFGHDKRLMLRRFDYDYSVDLFAKPEVTPQEQQFLQNVYRHLERQEAPAVPKQQYALGNRVLLVSDACEHCLALQYPISSRDNRPLPGFLADGAHAENKVVELDSFGLVEIATLDAVSHAACCPVRIEALTAVAEGEADERAVLHDLLTRAVSNVSFYFEVIWKIEAALPDGKHRFFGLTKQEALESLYVHVLETCCNYHRFAAGLTMKTAYLNAVRKWQGAKISKLQKRALDLSGSGLLKTLGFADQVVAASASSWNGLAELVCLEAVMQDGRKREAIGATIDHCLLDIWTQETQNRRPAHSLRATDQREGQLFQYHDAHSQKYKFILIGVNGHDATTSDL